VGSNALTLTLTGENFGGRTRLEVTWSATGTTTELQTTVEDPTRLTALLPAELLRTPAQHVIVNLLGLAAAERPPFFEALQPRLHALRTRTGRPHWIVVDEADQMLRAAGDRPATPVQGPGGTLLITAHPEHVASAILESVDTVLAVGHDPAATLRAVPGAARAAATVEAGLELPTDEALAWSTHLGESIARFTIVRPDFSDRRSAGLQTRTARGARRSAPE